MKRPLCTRRDAATSSSISALLTLIISVIGWGVGCPSAVAQALGQTPPATEAEQPSAISDAERVARLRQSIEDARSRLAEVRSKLAPADDPEKSELNQAEASFRGLDQQLKAKHAALEAATKTDDAQMVQALSIEVEELKPRWQLAKDRFDLALKEHKALQEQAATIEARLKQDEQALATLLAPAPKNAPQTPLPSGEPAPPASAKPEGDSSAEAPAGAAAPPQPPSGVPVTPADPSGQPAVTPTVISAPAQSPPKAEAKEVVEARERLHEKEAAAQVAEQEARTVEERYALLEKQVENERSLLETARRMAAVAAQQEATLEDQIAAKRQAGDPFENYQELSRTRREASLRKDKAFAEANEHAARIDALHNEIVELQADQIAALREAESKREDVTRAERDLEKLTDPFSLTNMRGWLLTRGPRVVGIVVAVAALLWGSRRIVRRLTTYFAKEAERGTYQDRLNRARTLASVLHNVFSIAVIAIGVLMLLSEFGVNAGPLLGGAAVIGLAVAFGSQNLIRDFFSGLMILLENQYGIDDVIKIGDVAGLVENVSMRVTVLRDLEGVVHFIPNGEIKVVSNMTHGWSRALFDINVSYKEDVDRVMEVLIDLATEMRRDPQWRHMILEKPHMLGVDGFGESSISIKFFIKTKPLKQWDIKRELLRRIKRRFDELGIDIPFQRSFLYHQHDGQPAPVLDGLAGDHDRREG